MFIYFGLTIVAQLLLFTAPQVEAGCASLKAGKFVSCFRQCWSTPLDDKTVLGLSNIANQTDTSTGSLISPPKVAEKDTPTNSFQRSSRINPPNTSSMQELPKKVDIYDLNSFPPKLHKTWTPNATLVKHSAKNRKKDKRISPQRKKGFSAAYFKAEEIFNDENFRLLSK
jgi:hypothetical protein